MLIKYQLKALVFDNPGMRPLTAAGRLRMKVKKNLLFKTKSLKKVNSELSFHW